MTLIYVQAYLKKGSLKEFPMTVGTMVGRRKEPILGYVPKNDKNMGSKWLRSNHQKKFL